MLGAIIGDICGSVYEFDNCKNYNEIELFRSDSTFTDDTVMTIAVAQALMDVSSLDENYADWTEEFKRLLIKSMHYYGELYPHAGYGGRFYNWLQSDSLAPYNSYGNGSGMRVSSIGWVFNNMDDTLMAAKLSSEVTHNHPEGIKGAQAIAGAVYLARTGHTKKDIQTFAEILGYNLDFTIDEIRPNYLFNVSCQKSVPQAIKCFLESKDFEQCIRLTISLGGDCDTTAAMSGAIAEAFYGIPEWMKNKALEKLPEPLLAQYERFKVYLATKQSF